jgi:hypothetical protein
MKPQVDETTQRVLVLLKLDAKRLFYRIRDREPEYLAVFSLKRSRTHFKEIFQSRYDDIKISELLHCSQDVIVGLDQFYSKVEELKWYLGYTEDMPGSVDEKVHHHIYELSTLYETLNLYINAELGLIENTEQDATNDQSDFSFAVESAEDDSEFLEGDAFGQDSQESALPSELSDEVLKDLNS